MKKATKAKSVGKTLALLVKERISRVLFAKCYNMRGRMIVATQIIAIQIVVKILVELSVFSNFS